jgi:predicted metal-binding membrane protein
MTTAVPIERASISSLSSAHLMVFCLIALGWSYSIAQMLALDFVGSLSEAGPGMQIFAAVQYYLLQDPFGFETSVYFCATTDATWGLLDFVKSFVMWLAMVLAMMLPNLFPLIKDIKARGANPARFLRGYLAVWIAFCVIGVVAQWTLRTLEVLNGHMVIAEPSISAALLYLVGAYQVSTHKSDRLEERKILQQGAGLKPCCQDIEIGTGYGASSGTVYGFACLRCCWPLMLTMFAFGLMNILAMGLLTVMMFMETNSVLRVNSEKIWGSIAFVLSLIFCVQSL